MYARVIEAARSRVKSEEYVENPVKREKFNSDYIEKKLVETIQVSTDEVTLTAHKIQLREAQNVADQKVIIYILNNVDSVASSLPCIDVLCRNIMKEDDASSGFVCYCQDYRGKGFNQIDPKKNFSHYSVAQDASDQAALIKHLIRSGHKPENIYILGHSYGSNVGLWAYHMLMQQDKACSAMTFMSHCGVGNPLKYSLIQTIPFLDENKLFEEAKSAGFLPDIHFCDIAMKLQEIFILAAENDQTIEPGISLINTVKQDEKPGRMWIVKAQDNGSDPHYQPLHFLQLKTIPEVNSSHFIAAIIVQKPVKLDFDFKSNVFAAALSLLNSYYAEQKDLEEKYGSDYNKSRFSKGFTVKQKIQTADEIRAIFDTENGINIETMQSRIEALRKAGGPHKDTNGRMYNIFVEIDKFVREFIKEYEQLQYFNAWIALMKQRRQQLAPQGNILENTFCLFTAEQEKSDNSTNCSFHLTNTGP